MKIKLVLNKRYGGFSFSREMAEWLRDNKGWRIGTHEDYEYKNSDVIGVNNQGYYPKNMDTFECRSNIDLIECVEVLQKKYKDVLENGSNAKRYEICGNLCALEVVELDIDIIIRSNDGIEKVVVECINGY